MTIAQIACFTCEDRLILPDHYDWLGDLRDFTPFTHLLRCHCNGQRAALAAASLLAITVLVYPDGVWLCSSARNSMLQAHFTPAGS